MFVFYFLLSALSHILSLFLSLIFTGLNYWISIFLTHYPYFCYFVFGSTTKLSKGEAYPPLFSSLTHTLLWTEYFSTSIE